MKNDHNQPTKSLHAVYVDPATFIRLKALSNESHISISKLISILASAADVTPPLVSLKSITAATSPEPKRQRYGL